MKWFGPSIAFTFILLVLPLFAQHPAAETEAAVGISSVRFASLHVTIDPHGEPLAAYQFKLTTTSGQVKIVGIEGGDHPAFSRPPYYDPEALMQDVIIVAAFSTDSSLPQTSCRIATLHLQITGDVQPEFQVNLTVAVNNQNQSVKATTHFELGEAQ